MILTQEEKQKSLQYLMFLKQKQGAAASKVGDVRMNASNESTKPRKRLVLTIFVKSLF
jgi:hypothetical protein